MGRVISHVSAEFRLLLGLLAFVGLAFGAQNLLPLDAPPSLPRLSALSLALMPTLLWLGFLSSDCQSWQDRQADRSQRIWQILSALLLGALLAGPVATQLIGFNNRLTSGGLAVLLMNDGQWLYALAIVGIAQESCKYAIAEICLGQTRDQVLNELTTLSPWRKLAIYTAVAIGFACYLSYLELRSGHGVSLGTAALLVSEKALFHILLASLLCIATSVSGQILGARYHALLRYGLHLVLIITALIAVASANALLALVSSSLSRTYSLGLIALLFLLFHGQAIRLSKPQSCDKEPVDHGPRLPSEPPISTRTPLRVTLPALCVCLSLYAAANYQVHHLALKALHWASHEGLRFQYPATWQALGESPLAPSALASTVPDAQTPPAPAPRWSARFADHVDAENFIEVEIIPSPRYPNLSGFLAITRLSRYGEGYKELSASKLSMGTEPTLWLRAAFQYQSQDKVGQSPASIHGIEYAAAKHGHLYVVTLHVRGVPSPVLDSALRSSLTLEKATR